MTSPMRSLIATRSLPFHSLGGMEVVAWDLARAFRNACAVVTVLTTLCSKLAAENMSLARASSRSGVNSYDRA